MSTIEACTALELPSNNSRIMLSIKYNVIRGQSRLYDILSTYIVLNECFFRAFSEDTSDWQPGEWMFYQCQAIGAYQVRLPLVGPVRGVKSGRTWDYISLTIAEFHGRPDPRLAEVNVNAFAFKLLTPFFTEFYENHVPLIREKFSGNPAEWPGVWNFARVIRNAIAHGGSLAIDSPNAPVARWQSLVYGHEQNGRAIFGTDIAVGDLLILMFELSKQLDEFDV